MIFEFLNPGKKEEFVLNLDGNTRKVISNPRPKYRTTHHTWKQGNFNTFKQANFQLKFPLKMLYLFTHYIKLGLTSTGSCISVFRPDK